MTGRLPDLEGWVDLFPGVARFVRRVLGHVDAIDGRHAERRDRGGRP